MASFDDKHIRSLDVIITADYIYWGKNVTNDGRGHHEHLTIIISNNKRMLVLNTCIVLTVQMLIADIITFLPTSYKISQLYKPYFIICCYICMCSSMKGNLKAVAGKWYAVLTDQNQSTYKRTNWTLTSKKATRTEGCNNSWVLTVFAAQYAYAGQWKNFQKHEPFLRLQHYGTFCFQAADESSSLQRSGHHYDFHTFDSCQT